MEDHGTAFPSWYITFQQAALAALPRPPELDQEVALGWAGNGKAFAKVLAETLLPKQEKQVVPTVSAYPADGEIFELTLNGDVPENDPIEMVRRDCYDPAGWKYIGKKVTGKQVRRFKLVRVGRCRNLNEVREKLVAHGSIPEGQWREAFKTAYPEPDENSPVGFADPSWVDPDGNANFPYIYGGGNSDFRWADNDFNEDRRWLVGVSK